MESDQIFKAYAAYAEDDIREKSSSGGIFFIIAKHVLGLGGVVYGVAMTPDCLSAEFIRAEDQETLERIITSKYLQANVGDTFWRVKRDLDSGMNVLFSGTGCQVNGLKNYLGNEYENLFCVDVICHGVPSQKLWNAYVENIEKKFDAKVTAVNFRSKYYGWRESGIKQIDSNHQQYFVPKEQDPYMQFFLRNECLRPSCYSCRVKTDRKCDITLGDYWGIEQDLPEFGDNKGVSLVIVRTKKGQVLFNIISDRFTFTETNYNNAIMHNPSDISSVAKPALRDSFYRDLDSLSFEAMKKKYIKTSMKKWIKRFIKMLLRTLKDKKLRI